MVTVHVRRELTIRPRPSHAAATAAVQHLVSEVAGACGRARAGARGARCGRERAAGGDYGQAGGLIRGRDHAVDVKVPSV